MDNKVKKKIVFLSGTRADFGKLKSLIEITNKHELFEVHIFATGMHMHAKYGLTVDEIEKCGYKNIYKFINQTTEASMDQTLAKTVEGFSNYVKEIQPDLIIIHGDRLEALAGAIVGAFNNILVAHIEGGEVSGTVDELIRHSVSKLSHTHFVANDMAQRRLIQMGEDPESVYVIGSPDVDVMLSDNLPSIDFVKKYYEIDFRKYAVLLFHTVTTEAEKIDAYAANLVDAVLESDLNYVVIYPNNDLGSNQILHQYERLKGNPKIKMFPSVRFEYFLVLLKYASFLIGNSSAGIREAPYYGLPTINIGTRQNNRAIHTDLINCGYGKEEISESIHKALIIKPEKSELYGEGKSDECFFEIISKESFWSKEKQKQFKDMVLQKS